MPQTEQTTGDADAQNDLILYGFPFRNKQLSMVGRPAVVSDQAIISNIFLSEMFATSRFPQDASLQRYYQALVATGRDPVLVDAGANIGAASLYFSELYDRLHLISIEPGPDNFALLQRNLDGRMARPVHGAVASVDGTLRLQTEHGPIGYRVGEAGDIDVRAYSMASIMGMLGENESPFIAKIDIEGAEQDLFSTDFDWVDQFPLVIVELHDWFIPFQNISRNFFRAISSFEFDVVTYGENTFCFNRSLLLQYHGQ